eukprot:2757545-Alexandrium_andersonii.AAC.1
MGWPVGAGSVAGSAPWRPLAAPGRASASGSHAIGPVAGPLQAWTRPGGLHVGHWNGPSGSRWADLQRAPAAAF